MKPDPFISEFLDILLDATGLDPAYVIPDMSLSELSLADEAIEKFKSSLEGHFQIDLGDVMTVKQQSCRDLVGFIKDMCSNNWSKAG